MVPDVFVHEYQVPPEASCVFTVAAVVGLIVYVTESMFSGFEAFRLYCTLVAVYPLIEFEPEPAVEPGTVFDAVNA